ncbi:MAG: chemotaxis protein CheD [Deltaproteobacteria bacterium]|nr:chemotaxis protein CheD [Deltaproteobacteria bacterium]
MKTIVGIADMRVSNDPSEVLVTFSLGSCIGVAVYDPEVKVGGMLHYMLPEMKLDMEKANKKPYMFADSGIPLLFKKAYELGAKKSRMVVKVAGGGQILDESGYFNIGKRNYAALRKLFWRNNVMIAAEDIGGNVNRTMYLRLSDGKSWLKISGKKEVVL